MRDIPKGVDKGAKEPFFLRRGKGFYRPKQKNRTFPILQEKFWKGASGATIKENGLKLFPK